MEIDWSKLKPDNIFVGPIFNETVSIRRIHGFPRFGYSKEFALIASENVAERSEYFYGLVLFPSIIAIFLVVWDVFLLVFWCIKRIRTKRNLKNLNFHSKKEEEETRQSLRVWFSIGSVIIIFFCMSVFVAGVSPLRACFVNIRNDVNSIQSLINATQYQLQAQHVESRLIREKRDDNIDEISEWCTSVQTNFSVSSNDLSMVAGNLTQNESYVVEVNNFKTSVEESYNSLNNMITHGAETVAESLERAYINAGEINDILKRTILWYTISEQFITIVSVLNVILLGCLLGLHVLYHTTFFDHSECFSVQCTHRWIRVLLPFFAFLMNFSYILSVGFCVGAMVTADLCTGSPEDNFVQVFHMKEQSMNHLLYDMSTYYVQSCMMRPVPYDKKPTKFIEDSLTSVQESIRVTDFFISEMNMYNASVIDFNCGGSIEKLKSNLAEFSNELNAYKDHVLQTSRSLYCDVFTPIYTDIMHDHICYQGVRSMGLVFVLLFGTSFVGLIMVSIAIARKDLLDDSNPVEARREGSVHSQSHEMAKDLPVFSADEKYMDNKKSLDENSSQDNLYGQSAHDFQRNVHQDYEDFDMVLNSRTKESLSEGEEEEEFELNIPIVSSHLNNSSLNDEKKPESPTSQFYVKSSSLKIEEELESTSTKRSSENDSEELELQIPVLSSRSLKVDD